MDALSVTNLPDLTGKTAVVTGATSGLGRATAMVLASRHANLVVIGRSDEKLEALKADLANAGAESVRCLRADLSDLNQVSQLIQSLRELPGVVNYAVLSAGVLLPKGQKRGASFYGRRYEIHMQVNFLSQALIMRALTGKMPNSTASRIVVVGSSGARMTLRRFSLERRPLFYHVDAYNASKLAITAFALWWQERIAAEGKAIQVHVVEPGIVRTGLFTGSTLMGRLISKGAKLPAEKAIGSILYAMFSLGIMPGEYAVLEKDGTVRRADPPRRAQDSGLQRLVSMSLDTLMR